MGGPRNDGVVCLPAYVLHRLVPRHRLVHLSLRDLVIVEHMHLGLCLCFFGSQAGNSLMTSAEPVLPTELCSRLKTVAPQKKMMARKLRTTPIVYSILP